MALNQALHRGDWVKATSKTGSVIVGQAAHDMHRSGYAALTILVGGDDSIARPEAVKEIEISVNYWDVETTHHNLTGAESQP